MNNSTIPFDKTSRAVLREINKRTPKHSIHRNFAAGHMANSSSHDWIGLETIAAKIDVDYTPRNADILATEIIAAHSDQFRDYKNIEAESIEQALDNVGAEYDGDAPELNGEITNSNYDLTLPNR